MQLYADFVKERTPSMMEDGGGSWDHRGAVILNPPRENRLLSVLREQGVDEPVRVELRYVVQRFPRAYEADGHLQLIC